MEQATYNVCGVLCVQSRGSGGGGRKKVVGQRAVRKGGKVDVHLDESYFHVYMSTFAKE